MPESKLLKEHCAALSPRLGHVLLDLLVSLGYIQLRTEEMVVPEANPFAKLAGAFDTSHTVRWYMPGDNVQLHHLLVEDEAVMLRPAGVRWLW